MFVTFTKKAVLWTVGLLGVPVLGVLLFAPAIFGDDGRDVASVIRVIDGDTVDVDLDGDETRIRLLNVDTPETKHPDEPVQCLGLEASQFLEDLLPVGTEVELDYDVEKEDSYGRTLAGLFHEDVLINAQIAAEGLGVAVVYEPNSKFYDEVKNAEQNAREEQVGLFDLQIECALPQQLAAVQDEIDQLDDALPDEIAGVEQELDDLEPIQVRVTGYHDLVTSLGRESPRDLEEKAFLLALYREQFKAFEEQLETNEASLEAREAKLKGHKEDLEIEAERQAEEERKRAEEERQAEEERKRAEEERQAEEEAAEQRRQEQASQQQHRQQPGVGDNDRAPTQQSEKSSGSSGSSGGSGSSGHPSPRPQSRAPSGNSAPSGYGTDSDYPGYTGPRCYAPGGQYWRPC